MSGGRGKASWANPNGRKTEEVRLDERRNKAQHVGTDWLVDTFVRKELLGIHVVYYCETAFGSRRCSRVRN